MSVEAGGGVMGGTRRQEACVGEMAELGVGDGLSWCLILCVADKSAVVSA